MAVTMLENLINPEVMQAMVSAKVENGLKLIKYAKLDNTLEGVPGNTITVPSWNYIGDAKDVAEGATIDSTLMTASTTQFTIKKVAKSVSLTNEAVLSGYGNPIGQAESQLARAIVGKMDSDILDAIYSANVYTPSAPTGAISYNGIVDLATKFEDEDEFDKVLFIHPAQETAMLKDPAFLSADKFDKGVAVRGAIGRVAGCWVKKSKRVKHVEFEKDNAGGTITIVADTVSEDGTSKHLDTVQPKCAEVLKVGDKVKTVAVSNQYYLNPVIKIEAEDENGANDELPAVKVFIKRDVTLEKDYSAVRQTSDLVATEYYGVALTNGSKVVLGKFKK